MKILIFNKHGETGLVTEYKSERYLKDYELSLNLSAPLSVMFSFESQNGGCVWVTCSFSSIIKFCVEFSVVIRFFTKVYYLLY